MPSTNIAITRRSCGYISGFIMPQSARIDSGAVPTHYVYWFQNICQFCVPFCSSISNVVARLNYSTQNSIFIQCSVSMYEYRYRNHFNSITSTTRMTAVGIRGCWGGRLGNIGCTWLSNLVVTGHNDEGMGIDVLPVISGQ